MTHRTISDYHAAQSPEDQKICDVLRAEIDAALPLAESKIWHAHPVWFLEDNPIVGYSKLKHCVRLLFWSGQSFEARGLAREGKFKAAEARFTEAQGIDHDLLRAWLAEAPLVQWDYKNIVKRKGRLERISVD
ncbi:DUF1801 domain-containing protein [Halocynthiibacter sp. C4]|uniref:DUF1801 domain-containing protein n=1 Tax=Halocynthiibacter sp. C4 TaxID=2992758 RepID=UPI00237AD24A|nr:DUF1801 domain-containing protein [Halocynthiibacter sp. C4]MDE0590376.1 DUF1801 domain-containing protein [Halocynthiibacter sp. C4]